MLDRIAPLFSVADSHQWKMIFASIVASGAAIADVVTDLPRAEDWTVKGILVAAVVYLVRQLSTERAEHKAEAEKREEKLTEALKTNAEAMDGMKAELSQQTSYFRDIAQRLIGLAIAHEQKPGQ